MRDDNILPAVESQLDALHTTAISPVQLKNVKIHYIYKKG